MKVKCVDDKISVNGPDKDLLTNGKEYDLLYVEGSYPDFIYKITDDYGVERFFCGFRFYPNPINLKKTQRNYKLESLIFK